jgi:hypothetical protein
LYNFQLLLCRPQVVRSCFLLCCCCCCCCCSGGPSCYGQQVLLPSFVSACCTKHGARFQPLSTAVLSHFKLQAPVMTMGCQSGRRV